MNNTDFDNLLKARTAEAEEIVRSYLPPVTGKADAIPDRPDVLLPLKTAEAMHYAVTAGGKRLRPVLMQCSFETFHGKNKGLLRPFMAAIEMIHTYSLIHDDLPAMDNDTYRRGKKTTHAVYGEAVGILAGDGLLNHAYETALSATESCADASELMQVVLSLRILSAKAGIRGMVGGQDADIASEKGALTLDKEAMLYFIQENKTAALIEAALMCGAILAGAEAEKVDAMEEVASRIGHAFQICDDVLDVTGQTQTLGKTAGKDAASGKLTYVSVYGLERAKEEIQKETHLAIERLHTLGVFDDTFFVRLLLSLTERDH